MNPTTQERGQNIQKKLSKYKQSEGDKPTNREGTTEENSQGIHKTTEECVLRVNNLQNDAKSKRQNQTKLTNNSVTTEIKSDKEWFQILAVCLAAMSSLSAAILFNWTSPTIPILISDEYPDIDITLASYLTVIPPVVTVVFSPICSILTEKYGRKYQLLSIGVFHILSWICIMFADTIYTFYVSRVFFGLADAAMFGVLPVYIAEVTTPKVRGTWGNAMGFGIYCGQLVMNIIGYYLDIKTTSYVLITIPIAFLILFLMMPETPYFYLMKGRRSDAEKALQRLRRTKDVEEELNRISSAIQDLEKTKGSFKDCFTDKTNRKAILLVSLARGMQQMAGISAIAVYTQMIFHEGMPEMDRGVSSIIYTASLTVAGLIGSMTTDKLGRKISMTLSCFGCALCLTAEAIYFYVKQETSINLSDVSWFPIVGMILYVLVFCAGLGLTPVLLLSELFSTSIRGKATCVLTIVYCIYITIVTKMFQLLNTNFGLYVPFGVFAICTYVSVILSYLYIPETRGKTLEEIQEMLNGNSKKNIT